MARRSGVGKRSSRSPVSYAKLDREEVSVGNPIDLAVHRRVGRGGLLRQLARASPAGVHPPGKRRRVWVDYARVLSPMTALRQAALLDPRGVPRAAAARGAPRQA